MWTWIRERNKGPIKGRSHLVNHIDMVFATDVKGYNRLDGREGRAAIIRVDDAEHPWRHFFGFEQEEERLRARNHVLSTSHLAIAYSQIEIALSDSGDAEPDWDAPLPEDMGKEGLLDLMATSTDLWADMIGTTLEQMMDTSSAFVLLSDWRPVVLDRIVVRGFDGSEGNGSALKRNDRNALKAKYGSSESWLAFCEGVCKNGYMKGRLAESQGGVCPVCGAPLGDGGAVVHHVDYDHECGLARQELFWELQGKGLRLVPDCQRCAEANRFISGCASRLRLVHRDCNYLAEITQ